MIRPRSLPRPRTLVAVLLAITTVIASCGDDDDTASEGPPPEEVEEDAQDETAIPDAEDLADVDRDDPGAVAVAWGCAYWAHPRGETPELLAERLGPLSTTEVHTALAELRISGLGSDTVEVAPGAATPADQGDTWTVRCNTITRRPDGTPAGGPAPVAIVVTVTETPTGWLVSQATLPDSGLTIP